MKKTDVAVSVSQEVSPVLKQVSDLVIVDEPSMSTGVEYLSRLNKYLDRVTDEKEKITVPLNEALKAERARWKPIETELTGMIDMLRARIGKYKTEADARAAKYDAKISKRVEAGRMGLEKAVVAMNEVERASDKVVSGSGSISFMEVLRFEVIEFSRLPDQFKIANEVEIRKVLKAGNVISGVKSWIEKVPKNRR